MMRQRMLPVLFLSCVLIAAAAPGAGGADFLSKVHPYITIQEEYTDNMDLEPDDEEEDFITTISPGIRYSDMGPTAGIELDYHVGYVMHAKHSDMNYFSHNAFLNTKYITPQRIGFYFQDTFIRSEDPRERDYLAPAGEDRYILSTRRERGVYWRNVAAPTVEYQFGPENRTGIRYRNNIYEAEDEVGQDSQENYVNPYIDYWFNRRHGVSFDYGLTLGSFEDDPDLVGHRFHGRYTNRFSEKSSFFVDYAYAIRTFDDDDDTADTQEDYDIHEPTVGITYAFTPTLTASAQVGYFWQTPEEGDGHDGVSYRGELRSTDPHTVYLLSVQGGYHEDYFTSDNLGFSRYHRIAASVTHQAAPRLSVGARGSIEWADYEFDRDDTIWQAGGNVSYMPLKWLRLSLDASHWEVSSTDDEAEYTENRVVLSITATY